METKQRNRTVRRYHRSMKTGEVLPCVAVEEASCRAEHLTERQAFEAAKQQAHEVERRKQEKEAKKAESRRRRREAQTAYMRKWRERKAQEATSKRCLCDEMDEDHCPVHARQERVSELGRWGEQFE